MEERFQREQFLNTSFLTHRDLVFPVTACKQLCILFRHLSINVYQSYIIFLSPDPDAALTNKNHQDVRSYVRQLNVIDNQRTLSQMSHRLEPRRA